MMLMMLMLVETKRENLHPLPELWTDNVVCSEVVIVNDNDGYDDDGDDVDDVDDGETKRENLHPLSELGTDKC